MRGGTAILFSCLLADRQGVFLFSLSLSPKYAPQKYLPGKAAKSDRRALPRRLEEVPLAPGGLLGHLQETLPLGMPRVNAALQCTSPQAGQSWSLLSESADESPALRALLARVRKGGGECNFRTRVHSGELRKGISNKRKRDYRSDRRRCNRDLADRVDPPMPTAPPTLPAPTQVSGYVGRPSQDARIRPPERMTRSAAAEGWNPVRNESDGVTLHQTIRHDAPAHGPLALP